MSLSPRILAALFAGIAWLSFSSTAFAQFPGQLGDVNRDGNVDTNDGPALALAMTDLNTYKVAFGITDADLLTILDLNFDGRANNQDFHALFAIYNGGSTPSNNQSGMLYLSTSGTNPGAASPMSAAATNPNITITQGATTTLYLWAQVSNLESINGLSLDINSSQGSVVSAMSRSILNPTSGSGANAFARWNQINPGTLGSAGSTELLSGVNAVKVTGNYFGLDGAEGLAENGVYVPQGAGADGSGARMVGSLLVGSVTVMGTALGTTELFLESGQKTIVYEEGLGGPFINYGAGDALVNAALENVASVLADATITVVPVPEPSCLLLLLSAAVGLVSLRRTFR